jgi:hypothetical protein
LPEHEQNADFVTPLDSPDSGSGARPAGGPIF